MVGRLPHAFGKMCTYYYPAGALRLNDGAADRDGGGEYTEATDKTLLKTGGIGNSKLFSNSGT